MNRRELIARLTGLLAGAAAMPTAIDAQQRPKIPRIGIIDDGAM
jgi:hypothetical protein